MPSSHTFRMGPYEFFWTGKIFVVHCSMIVDDQLVEIVKSQGRTMTEARVSLDDALTLMIKHWPESSGPDATKGESDADDQ